MEEFKFLNFLFNNLKNYHWILINYLILVILLYFEHVKGDIKTISLIFYQLHKFKVIKKLFNYYLKIN